MLGRDCDPVCVQAVFRMCGMWWIYLFVCVCVCVGERQRLLICRVGRVMDTHYKVILK